MAESQCHLVAVIVCIYFCQTICTPWTECVSLTVFLRERHGVAMQYKVVTEGKILL